jgi:hypothetical protein
MSGGVSAEQAATLRKGGRRRFAKGPKRPSYLRAEDTDRLFFTLVNALGEISALRDRLDTHEALAEQGIVPTRAAVEAYRPDKAHDAARRNDRAMTLRRVFRLIMEDYEAKVTLGKAPDFSSNIPTLDP